MYSYHGKISYTIDKEHPDISCLEDWSEDRVYTFEDTYFFNEHHTVDEIKSHIKRDLMLVVSGGYNTNHIHNVQFEIS